jgi:hypothetical protein
MLYELGRKFTCPYARAFINGQVLLTFRLKGQMGFNPPQLKNSIALQVRKNTSATTELGSGETDLDQ